MMDDGNLREAVVLICFRSLQFLHHEKYSKGPSNYMY
jgi:hypothetical protein